MGLTTSEVQSYIDNDGYVFFGPGQHTLTSAVILKGDKNVIIEGHPKATVVYTGPSTDAMFLFDKTVINVAKTLFRDLTAISNTAGAPVFKTFEEYDFPYFLTMERCEFTASETYCIDINQISYVIVPSFKDMKTHGGGAVRFKASKGGAVPYHATSQHHMERWVHNGSNRVGPAFDLRGTSGLRMYDTVDKGSTDLLPALRGVYNGPISFRIDAPRTPGFCMNYTCEYDEGDTWANASGCWLHEIRTDNASGIGKHEYFRWINGTLRDSNIDEGVEPMRLMGGGTVTTDGLVVDIEDCEDVAATDFRFGGRLWPRAIRPWYNPGMESVAAAAEAAFNQYTGGSFIDPIFTSTTKVPGPTSAAGPTYEAGFEYYDNWEAAAAEFETLI